MGSIQFSVEMTLSHVIFLALIISYFPSLIIYIVKEISRYQLIEYFDFANIRRIVLIILVLMIQIGDNENNQYTLDVIIVVGIMLCTLLYSF